jgi:hypothetical protein
MESQTKVNIDDLIVMFDPYEVSMDYNPHKGMHQTIAEYFEGSEDHFIDYDECIKTDKVYVVRVYPDTAVGFYEICSRWHDDAINRMIEVLRKDRATKKR